MPRENPFKAKVETVQRELFDFKETDIPNVEANTSFPLESLSTEELNDKFKDYLDIPPSGLLRAEKESLLQMPKDDALAFMRLRQAEEDRDDLKATYLH